MTPWTQKATDLSAGSHTHHVFKTFRLRTRGQRRLKYFPDQRTVSSSAWSRNPAKPKMPFRFLSDTEKHVKKEHHRKENDSSEFCPRFPSEVQVTVPRHVVQCKACQKIRWLAIARRLNESAARKRARREIPSTPDCWLRWAYKVWRTPVPAINNLH